MTNLRTTVILKTDIVERYKLNISIGVHKGNLNVIRSYVFGDDIHTTVHLSELDRFYQPGQDGICVIASGKIRDEFKGTDQEVKFKELDRERITQEVYKMIIREHGGFEFVLKDVPQI